jgi:hypothetical protein
MFRDPLFGAKHMAQSNIIVNGSFDLGNTGWSGTDLETSYTEGAYLGNGSSNRVAEMDGFGNQTTVMQQVVTIENALDTELTFRAALRTASTGNAGSEGFRVDILDAQGQVIATQTFFPTATTWTAFSVPVSFPAAGDYTLRLTELGPNDSLGPIIDDVSMLVCFVAGTIIDTATGPVPVEDLRPGDLIWTKDAGLQPLRWIGKRRIAIADLIANPALRPVIFDPGALGDARPDRLLELSPQHRLCLGGWKTELHFGEGEVLVPAQALINGTTIRQAPPAKDVTYVHFLLDGHQIVRSNGVLSESFFPTELSLTGLDRATCAELMGLFPDLARLRRAYPRTARPVLRKTEAKLAL